MRYIYMKRKPRDLTFGSRLEFIRRLRMYTQDEISDVLGITGECKRRTITRYETNERIPKDDRKRILANILQVNFNALKEYTFENVEDYIYFFMWLEESFPNYKISILNRKISNNSRESIIEKFLVEWESKKEEKKNNKITYLEYEDWK